MYRRILVALDQHEAASQVLAKARNLSETYSAELWLLHVVECAATVYAGDLIMPEDLGFCDDLAERATTKFTALAATAAVPADRVSVRIGVPKFEITAMANEIGADLIVLGSHGRHGWRLILGSTANGVLHLAEADVLAVRIGKEGAAG